MQSAKLKTKLKPSQVTTSWQFEAIGTQWWIGVFEQVETQKMRELQQLVAERIEQFDQAYSRFRDDSLVSRIAEQAGSYTFPADSRELFELYRALYELTGGAMTPLIGNMLVAAGYDVAYSFKPKTLHKLQAWDDVMRFEGNVLTVHRPVTLDFGAAGKGYLVDLVTEILQAHGISKFCVDAGGDLNVRGDEHSRVGLEHPDNPKQVIGVAELHNRAIAGSAPNRRVWAGYHHVMNPNTLRSTTSLKAAWVVADSCLWADGLATALFFVSPEELSQFNFEYLLVNDKNKYKRSPGFPAELF